MLKIQTVGSLDYPELAPYRTMRQQLDHRCRRIFVAEGEKIVRRLLESPFTVVSLLLTDAWLRTLMPLLESRPEEIHAYVADKAQLEKLIGFTFYQGVMAIGKIPAPQSLEALLKTTDRPLLFAAVDGISNAENLGVLVRNCAAFGGQALIVGETSSSPYLRRAVRSSMGAIFKLPVVEVASLAHTLGELRARKVRGVAAHPHVDRRILAQAHLTSDCCLVFGSEGAGISPGVLEACDEAVAIPMQSGVDSLNVGSASAVFFYEACRQRSVGQTTVGRPVPGNGPSFPIA